VVTAKFYQYAIAVVVEDGVALVLVEGAFAVDIVTVE
jgi:hypothetical protein